MKGAGCKLTKAFKRMTRLGSSRSRDESSSCQSPEPTPTPTTKDYEQDEQDEQDDAPYLDLRDDHKRQAYAMIKHRSFGHTRTFDPELLEKTGMDVDFARVWHAVGWDDFVPIEENGSHLLTIQFLCTLWEVDDSVSFWLSGVERYFNWRIFSHLLGFSACLPVSLAKACRCFDRHEF